MSKVIERTGDLLECTGEGHYICHQTNCLRIGRGAGLSVAIFEKFPCADTYKNRTVPSTPGTIDVFLDPSTETHIVNMYGQNHWEPRAETEETREAWFAECLKALEASIMSGKTWKPIHIYFPKLIGCGLAAGNWDHYRKMIFDWAETSNYPNLSVSIVEKVT